MQEAIILICVVPVLWVWYSMAPSGNNELTVLSPLTHWGRVTHICVGKLTIIGSDNWLVAWTAPSNYLNQSWDIVSWTLRNKLQWNLKQNSVVSIQENAFENGVCEMASILFRPPCVNQCSVEVSEKWGQMTCHTGKYGDIDNTSGVSSFILPLLTSNLFGTWAPINKMIGDIPDFTVLNVPLSSLGITMH